MIAIFDFSAYPQLRVKKIEFAEEEQNFSSDVFALTGSSVSRAKIR